MLKNILLALFAAVVIPIILFWKDDIPPEQLKEDYTDMDSRFIEIEGMPVHYKDEGSGIPLVLLHGTASSLHTWQGWAEELKGNFRVIRPDLPAFGLTGPNPEGVYTIEFYTRFLKQFLDTLEVKHCYLAGNSLGGGIAWSFAAEYPEYIHKLIVLDASGYPVESSPFIFTLARVPVVSHLLRHITPKFIVENNVEAVYFNDEKVTDELVERYYELTLREGNRQAFIDRARSGGNSYSTEAIRKIDVPTLIMWGKHDEWIPVQDAYRFEEDIPESHLKIYENAGHVPMEEIPEQTARDARAFLLNPDLPKQ